MNVKAAIYSTVIALFIVVATLGTFYFTFVHPHILIGIFAAALGLVVFVWFVTLIGNLWVSLYKKFS